MGDKYHRLIVFVVDICPDPLRKLFEQLAKKDTSPGSAFTTLDAYMNFRKSDVNQLKLKKLIRNNQYDLIYPNTGGIDMEQWDITLLATLLLNLFTLPKCDKISVENLRSYRNDLQHKPATQQVSDNEFNILWSQLTTHTLRIASQVGGSAEVKALSDRIAEASVQNMPALGNTLQKWFLDSNSEMRYELQSIKETNECCQNILNGATVPCIGPSGEKVKRMKTVDHILKKLQENFAITMKTELPNEFVPTQEIADVKAKLRHNHRVVVTGYGSTRYLQIALEAIKSIHVDIERCVEMTEADDWRHIDPADVDVVLCKFPFGRIELQRDRVEKMINVYDSMMYTSTQENEDDVVLDIVIVSELQILQKAVEYFNHGILKEDDIVRVYGVEGGNVADKAGDRTWSDNKPCGNILKNMIDNSNTLMEYHKMPIKNLGLLENAEMKLQTNKHLLIVGPRKCGKTTLAVHIASHMNTQCLVLSDADEIKYIEWTKVGVIILENFTGKYEYSKTKAIQWYEKFDILQARIEKMKLYLIITCEVQMLKQCKQDIGDHQFLQHEVILSCDNSILKASTSDSLGIQIQDDTKSDGDASINSGQMQASLWFSKAELKKHRALDLKYKTVVDVCSRANTIIVAMNGAKYLDPNTNILYELSANLDVLHTYSIEQYVASVCSTNAEDVVAAGGRHIAILELNSGFCRRTKNREIDYVCCCVRSRSASIVAVDNEGNFHVYNGDLKQLFVVNSGHDFPVFQYNNIYGLVALKETEVAVLKADAVIFVDFKDRTDPNIKSISFVGVPQAICASEGSTFVLCCNGSTGECSIVQICNETQELSVISLLNSEYHFYNIFSCLPMCFDKMKSRLVVCSKEVVLDEIYLK
ncbi:uncharacterized protein LOC123538236 [Mercenaria mercenaria]|uniref:uncharacterized protein LOC123538236 n=1 Tax=Mercenaria mercenaria TaxID=6596 RepID=UPI00234FA5A1|nr:uncharacterized protein LOC123538236 [Mercenaria mercenaria]XP_053386037.1 uncharacterized protein LOC123538236 [Mercenaria mercenaria]